MRRRICGSELLGILGIGTVNGRGSPTDTRGVELLYCFTNPDVSLIETNFFFLFVWGILKAETSEPNQVKWIFLWRVNDEPAKLSSTHTASMVPIWNWWLLELLCSADIFPKPILIWNDFESTPSVFGFQRPAGRSLFSTMLLGVDSTTASRAMGFVEARGPALLHLTSMGIRAYELTGNTSWSG